MLSPPAPRRQSHHSSRPSTSSGLRTDIESLSPPSSSSSTPPTYPYSSLSPPPNHHNHLTKQKSAMPGSPSSSSPSENSALRNWRAAKHRMFESVRRSVSSPRKSSESNTPEPGMYSTPAERFTPPRNTNAFGSHRDRDLLSVRPPSVAQIAVGLHTSRTPYLPTHRPQRALSRVGSYNRGDYGRLTTLSEPDHGNGASTPLSYSSRPSSSNSLAKVGKYGSTTSIQPSQPLRSSLKKPSNSLMTSSTPSGSITHDRSTSPSLTLSASTLASSTSAPRTPLHSPAWLARLLQKQKSRTASSEHTASTTSLPSIGSMGEPQKKVVRFRGDDGGEGPGIHSRKDSSDTVKILQPSPRRPEPRMTFE